MDEVLVCIGVGSGLCRLVAASVTSDAVGGAIALSLGGEEAKVGVVVGKGLADAAVGTTGVDVGAATRIEGVG